MAETLNLRLDFISVDRIRQILNLHKYSNSIEENEHG